VNPKDEVDFRYEGDKNKRDALMCVFTYKGRDYRLMYFKMSYFAELYDMPEPVRERILGWAKMLNNPD
jgi:hypothetical protein